MKRILFENVRCFRSRQSVELAPLTVLVGENSSGKSTFLALVRLAWDMALALQPTTPDFNEEPFLLGAYDQILSVGADAERESFILGLEVETENGLATLVGRFGVSRGQPVLRERLLDSKVIHTPLSGDFSREEEDDRRLVAERMVDIWDAIGARPYAFAPIRTRPQRTYDPIKSLESPEGSHVPTLLASTLLSDPEDWKRLVDALDSFGRYSGLFERVEVRRLGSSQSDPFQIRVHVGGKAVNLIDVGYGVSQILPLVVDCLRGTQGGTFLLQQPEVHLHPRAQAELGSFLGVLAKEQEKRFVIETHSDYLVDRIRMDVRDGKNGLRPEDVALLYFERSNGEARIHRIELDDQGNLVNVPPGYRSFFLEEERRFLGG